MRTIHLISFLSALSVAPSAGAQMMGHSIDVEYMFPDFGVVIESRTTIVSDQVEFPSGTYDRLVYFDLDLDGDWIELHFNTASLFFSGANFNGLRFRDAQANLPPIVGFSVESSSAGMQNMAGVTPGFNEQECWVDFFLVGSSVPGDWIRFKVDFGTVGTSYCLGDGTGGPCPCGNPGSPLEGCANSTGAGSLLLATGTPRVGVDDLGFVVSGLLPAQPALLFAGRNEVGGGNGAFFGDGLRCASGNVVPLGVRMSDAAGSATWTSGLGAAGDWSSGDTRRFQVLYRDPVNSPCAAGFNSSNGVELVFQP